MLTDKQNVPTGEKQRFAILDVLRGLALGLVYVELTALAVFVLQTVLYRCWLRYFRFGPLEQFGTWPPMAIISLSKKVKR